MGGRRVRSWRNHELDDHFGSSTCSCSLGLHFIVFSLPGPPSTMALCAKTMEMATASKVSADVVNWFVKAGFTSYSEISLLASEERDVKADIIEPMKADQENKVDSAKTHIGVVNIQIFLEGMPRARRVGQGPKRRNTGRRSHPVRGCAIA